MKKLLSIIISNRNDTAMLSITVNSCIEELRPLGLDKCEIIICDNSDNKIYEQLNSYLPIGYLRDGLIKVARQDFPCLFTAREEAIKYSTGKYLCCIDSHMIVGRDMFVDLVNFMDCHEGNESLAFAHAPIRWAHFHERSAKHDRDMSVNELGDWNNRYSEERIITWKGMPWICRRELWQAINGYGALSQYKISWGGGDMHIGIKPWLLGFRNWAVPCNAAVHIGPFPGKGKDHQYRLYASSGEYPHTFGFLVSCYVLGGMSMIERNLPALTKRFGQYLSFNNWISKAVELGKEEKIWLDERKQMTFEQLLERQPWNDSEVSAAA